MVGPNLGFDLTRRNNRWTFGTGASIFLGVNNQSFFYHDRTHVNFTEGLESNSNNNSWWSYVTSNVRTLYGVSDVLDSDIRNTTRWYRNRTVFSPGAGFQFSAKWQWTDAIGIKVGIDTNIMSNIARGSDLVAKATYTEEVAPMFTRDANTGQWEFTDHNVSRKRDEKVDFSLRSRGETLILYGISIGLEMRR